MTKPIDRSVSHLYKITDTVTGKFYMGKHGGLSQNGYWGSGNRIKRHIKKYGTKNMKYEVLVIGTEQYIFDLEKQYITEEFIKENKDCLNLSAGGLGGNFGLVPYNKGMKMSDECRRKQSLVKKGKPSHRKGSKHKPESIEMMKKNHPRTPISEAGKQSIIKANTGRKHIKVKCPHCNLIGGIVAMPRWHFDNCRNKGIV